MRLEDIRVIYNAGVQPFGHQGLENSTGGHKLCRKLKAECIAMMRSGMKNYKVCEIMGVKPPTMSVWRREV